jgi:hypothetical protein
MIDTSGFYNQDSLIRSANSVYGPGFTLLRQDKDTYDYPVQGWWWFDNAFQAAQAFNVRLRDFTLDLPPNAFNTAGFYSAEHKLRAGKFVYGPGFTLLAELKDTYTYPVNGWVWFDSAQDAIASLSLTLNQINVDLPTEDAELWSAIYD